MVPDESIAQLLEMGFSEEKAEVALQLANNNVEDALAFLLNDEEPSRPDIEPLTGPSSDQNQRPEDEDFSSNVRTRVDQIDSSMSDFLITKDEQDQDDMSYKFTNSSEQTGPNFSSDQLDQRAPELPGRPTVHTHPSESKNIKEFIDADLKRTLSTFVDQQLTPNSDDVEVDEYNVFQDFSKHLRPDFLPPVVVPGMRNLLVAYFAPLIMILHEVTPFRNTVMEHDFHDYGFDKTWYETAVKSRTNSDLGSPSKFIFENQILLAFLDGDSERFFASIKSLLASLPSYFLEDLERIESVDELLTCVHNTYIAELKKTNDLVSSRFETLFHCKFNPLNQPEVHASCFSIEFEQIRSNLYRSLYSIIIGENSERENDIDITQFSDIITIPILPPDDMFSLPSSQEMLIPETFHPQVYSKEHSQVYKDIMNHHAELVNKRHQVTRDKQMLTSFRGQKVVDALRASLEALNAEIDELSLKADLEEDVDDEKLSKLTTAAKDIESFCHNFQEKSELLGRERAALTLEIEAFDLTHDINKLMANLEELYILTGVIFDESNFHYLVKDRDPASDNEKQWISIEYLDNNFHMEKSSFEKLQNDVLKITSSPRIFTNAIVLIYCRASCWDNREMKAPLPTGLAKYMAEDKANLHDMLRYVEDSSVSDGVEEVEIDEYLNNDTDEPTDTFHKLEDDDEDLVEIESPVTGKPPTAENGAVNDGI